MNWAIRRRSKSGEHLIGSFGVFKNSQPPVFCLSGVPLLFNTRREAREFIETNYGYIRQRDDLKNDPHGWKVPIPVRVKVTVEEIGKAAE